MWTYRTKKKRHPTDVEKYFQEVPCKVIHSHGIVPAIRDYYCKNTTSNEQGIGGAGVNVCDMLTFLEAYE